MCFCIRGNLSFNNCQVQQLLLALVFDGVTGIQFNSIQFIQWSQMHAQQSFLNVCNTAILGYHGDKIILHKNVKNIKYVTNHTLLNYQICQDHWLFD